MKEKTEQSFNILMINTNLIHCWGNLRNGKQLLELLRGEIANTNHSGKAKSVTFLHCMPYTAQVDGHKIFPFNWEMGLAGLCGHWPMN